MIKGVLALLLIFLLIGMGTAQLQCIAIQKDYQHVLIMIEDDIGNNTKIVIGAYDLVISDSGHVSFEGVLYDESYNVTVAKLDGGMDT
jgi:hypothetical protein